jgi:hypothetical protein
MLGRLMMAGVVILLCQVGRAQAQFPVPADEEGWKAYNHVKSVLATMPGPMRRANAYDFREFCEVSSDPDFLAWASMTKWERMQKQHEMEATRAITKPIRESTGYILYNGNRYGRGPAILQPAGEGLNILLSP